MATNRKSFIVKNFISATFGNIINTILTFVSKTIFIYYLGTVYNGINGLFTNIIGMLSLAELGIGAAISFSLYKPLAENNISKIQAIMKFYKHAYRLIAGVVLVLGASIIPFLDIIVKDNSYIGNLTEYYLIYLFNAVSSYLLIYKTTLIEADQKSYIINNINTISRTLITIAQILALLLFKSFLGFLLVGMIMQLIGNIYLYICCDQQYSYLKNKTSERLSIEEKYTIFVKIRALLAHKIGDKLVNQTDSIIISYFTSVAVLGVVSNYTMIINLVNTFIIAFFNSATASLGNVIVTERTDKRLMVGLRYDFLGYLFYGWSFLCLYFLLTPFITIWIGSNKTINKEICFLLCLNFFLTGIRVPFSNVKSAAGVYEQDKLVPIVQAIVNVIVSIYGARMLGLRGVYYGTLISSMVPLFIRPAIVYKYIFKKSVLSYYAEMIYRLFQMIIVIMTLSFLFDKICVENLIILMLVRFLVCTVIMLINVYLFYYNRDELRYIKNIVRNIIKILFRRVQL